MDSSSRLDVLSHGNVSAAALRLVPDLGAEHRDELLHLLICPDCREAAVAHLVAAPAPPAQEATVYDYSAVFRRLESRRPRLIQETRRRRSEMEELLAELSRLPERQRRRALDDPRFQRPDLLDRLLEDCRDQCVADPAAALATARLAAALARRLGGCRSKVAYAFCLEAEAFRHLGKLIHAETSLQRALGFLEALADRAIYCRSLALLRWEQGRPDEAAALLAHSACLLGEEGLRSEEAVSLALLGLLHAEQGERAPALQALMAACPGLSTRSRPALRVRAGLTLALTFASFELRNQARLAREGAWRFYGEVRDELELLRIYGLEARLLAEMSEPEEALALYEPVLGKLLARGELTEAALAAVEIAGLLVRLGRADEIADRLAAVRAACATRRDLEEAVRMLAALSAAENREALETRARYVLRHLRQRFRRAGLRVEPPPSS